MPFAQLKDIRLHYQWVNENASGPIIVFLHEALGSIGQWKDFPELLCRATNCRGLIYERQGHGKSTGLTSVRTPNYMHDYAWQELPELLNALEIEEKVHLFGHSDGGSIALLFSAKHPEKVNKVITEAAHVIVEDVTLNGIKPVREHFLSDPVFKEKLARYHFDNTESIFLAWCDTWLSPDFRNWDITQEIKSIQATLLSFQGSDDEYGTHEQLDLIKKSVGQNALVKEIAGCKHIPHLEKKEEVLELSHDFLVGSI
ncbi:alpha/beta fold hydrolase [Salibacter halophilus]|uniref:Alpha/beta hydrolase n=1 Tax=Salibacter halophilus TaxID=1803916 RepID=A0A6N6MEX5_9FLAO|nr:alpha/beta hydrolase [Salibacter halophilus]KAB1066275.1 alpha/beta hydrolase [Salibacter halophilus]